ncbi:unnamed protein product [Musa hybrid cultivar]
MGDQCVRVEAGLSPFSHATVDLRTGVLDVVLQSCITGREVAEEQDTGSQVLEPSCEARAREFSYSDDAALDSLGEEDMACKTFRNTKLWPRGISAVAFILNHAVGIICFCDNDMKTILPTSSSP